MNDDDPSADQDLVLRVRIAKLRQEHQDLDAAVHALERGPQPDQIQIARLKKKKLILRDEIKQLEDQLTPDIIA
ncbi:MAG: YdcH family protein [Caulobacteraceae bacterium]